MLVRISWKAEHVIPQLQTNNGTFFGRYWSETSLLRRYVSSDANLSILSFGCSTGEELALLRRLFPAARLFGCDHDWHSLMAARALMGGDAVIFDSARSDIAAHGPFDIIVCNSVLLSHTVRNGQGVLKGIDSELWLAAVQAIDAALSPGGLLQVINSNIPFRMHPVAVGYRALRSPLLLGPNYVDQFDLDGRHLCSGVPGSGLSAMLNVHVAGEQWAQLRPDDLHDVHFQKAGGQAVTPVLDQKLPNLRDAPVRASGSFTHRLAVQPSLQSAYIEIDGRWSSVGTDGVRIERTARHIWFDGATASEKIVTIEMEGPLASAFLESSLGRPSMRLTLQALDSRLPVYSPVF